MRRTDRASRLHPRHTVAEQLASALMAFAITVGAVSAAVGLLGWARP